MFLWNSKNCRVHQNPWNHSGYWAINKCRPINIFWLLSKIHDFMLISKPNHASINDKASCDLDKVKVTKQHEQKSYNKWTTQWILNPAETIETSFELWSICVPEHQNRKMSGCRQKSKVASVFNHSKLMDKSNFLHWIPVIPILEEWSNGNFNSFKSVTSLRQYKL